MDVNTQLLALIQCLTQPLTHNRSLKKPLIRLLTRLLIDLPLILTPPLLTRNRQLRSQLILINRPRSIQPPRSPSLLLPRIGTVMGLAPTGQTSMITVKLVLTETLAFCGSDSALDGNHLVISKYPVDNGNLLEDGFHL